MYKNKRCKKCFKLEIKLFFCSSVICEECGTQYMGETANKLHIRMNLQRSGKTGCPEHFNSCCKDKSYIIQIIEVLSGNGHDENGIVDENNCRLR